MGQPNYSNGFDLALQPHMLQLPFRWKTPQIVFVNSMSDLFHKNVPTSYVHQVFDVMVSANWHCYQILTKRSERLMHLSCDLPWASNIWMGVSVENTDYTFRIDHLRQTTAHVKFLSLEPLLSELPCLDLRGINWVIVGGESGPGARVMKKEWVLEIRDQCVTANVPFFFKQWGGTNKKRAGRELEGRFWNQMPTLVTA